MDGENLEVVECKMSYRFLAFVMFCDEFKPIPEFLEGEKWIEENSDFDIFYKQTKDSILRRNEKNYNSESDCYWIHSQNFSEARKAKFKDNVNVNLLFWGHDSRPCLAGGTFGGSQGLYNKPFVDIPYDVWWWNEPPNPEFSWDLSNQGAAIVVHELINAIQCMIRDPFPFGLNYSDFPTYEDAPISIARDQHAWILNQITDEMYEKIHVLVVL